MNDWIHKMISTRTQAFSEACADENVTAAYIEGALSDQEKLVFETHVSECAVCRDVLALVMKMKDEEQKTFAPERDKSMPSRKTWFRFSFPIPVLGGVFVAIILTAGIFLLIRDSGENLHPTQSAQLHLPVPEKEMLKQNIPETYSEKRDAGQKLEPPPMTFPKEGIEARVAPARELKKEAILSAASSNQMATLQSEHSARLNEGATLSSVRELSVAAPTLRMKGQRADGPQSSIQEDNAAEADIKDLEEPKGSASRKIGDKEFYWDSGYWTDRQCLQHPEVPVIEIAPANPEYKSIVERYPDLLTLKPVRIFSVDRIYIFR